MQALLDASNVSVTVKVPHQHEPLVVVDKVSFVVSPGVSYAVLGRSGAGKTSLLSVLGLLNTAYTGKLLAGGVDVAKLSDRELARFRATELGFVFQSYSLIPHLNALANVLVPCAAAGLRRSVALLRAKAALDAVGLGDRLGAMPVQLSGGEQQRVAIARAIANHPRVILADEPTGALDTDTGASIMNSLVSRVREAGIALVVVTHDRQVAGLCDQHFIMQRGVITRDTGVQTSQRAHRVAEVDEL